MKIYKRDGFIADFIPTKIETSISNCAHDLNSPLTEGDIKYITKCAVKKIKEIRRDENFTSSYEVKGVVYRLLIECGFQDIAKEYILR